MCALESKKLTDFDKQAQLLSWPMRNVQDHAATAQMLLDGRADYFIAEQNQQQLSLQSTHQFGFFEMLDPPVVTHQLFVALSKDSACNNLDMRNKLSKALIELTKSTAAQARLNAVMQQWQALNPSDSSEKSE